MRDDEQRKDIAAVLKEIGADRVCCRRMLTTHVELVDVIGT